LQGFRVRGTVRSLKDNKKFNAIFKIRPDFNSKITLYEANLMNDQGWNEAIAGCYYVIHVASPFPSKPPEKEEDLINPAI
jgi:dihydroflavonol-4-reductase